MLREDKLRKLRDKMALAGLNAVIIPSTDPHSSEYVHEHWKSRAWFSGFNGSAGTLVVTENMSGLWTDFRYYIEASNVLKECEIELYRDGLEETPSILDFLKSNLKKGDTLGFDGTLFYTSDFEKYNLELKKFDISIDNSFDPVEGLWEDRPEAPMSKAFDLPVRFSGESREDKILRVRNKMKGVGANTYIVSSLADIAWLLNIRGEDVRFTPLIVSYLIVDLNNVNLFIKNEKLPKKLKVELEKAGITINNYDVIGDYIIKLKKDSVIYYMPESLNCFLSTLINQDIKVIRGVDLVTDLKAIKNKTEIDNIRSAMEKDGAALVKFFKEFEHRIKDEEFTEYTLAPLLREKRLGMEGCVDESFSPIIGYHSNGALCHYSADEKSAKLIKRDGLLLIDSGGQYYEGTTDITRTISLGNATVEEILHYTLVLKGHIKLSMAKFPEGTTGAQLDILAREPLWEHGLNFGHGTGHGVGYFLGVHEGPQNISPKGFKAPIKEGMITSNEPGLYIEGKHGIRIENLVLTKFDSDGLYQKFLGFETLTLYPYDLELIDSELLTSKEIEWINNYHKEVKTRLSKYLTADENTWLEDKTREI